MTKRSTSVLLKLTALAMMCLLLSCGAGRLYINPEADMGFYETVGILPFSNLTSDRTASNKVTSSFITEILKLDAIRVANIGNFNAAATEILEGTLPDSPGDITADQAFRIGQQAEVQGFFAGAVTQYGMVRSGQEEFPLVAVIVRFIDCQTGTVVWSYETSQKGGPKFPIFSFGETHTLGNMTTKVCEDVAGAFGNVAR